MYNLLEYSKNYAKTSVTLWNYSKDISTDPIAKPFKHKTSLAGKTAYDGNTKEVEFSVPLKCLSNFLKNLNILLINYEVNLSLTWSKNCVLTDMTTHNAIPEQGDVPAILAINARIGATFKITDTKLYVLVVTLPTKADNKLLEQLKTGFKRTIKLKKIQV